jgi:hypothetical protein
MFRSSGAQVSADLCTFSGTFPPTYTDKNKINFPHIYKEIQSVAVAKSHMRKGFLIYEEMRKYFHIYDFATALFEFPYI